MIERSEEARLREREIRELNEERRMREREYLREHNH